MQAEPVKVGIVGLGRWARVLGRAAARSSALTIVAGYSRSEDRRTAFERETGVRSVPSLDVMLSDPSIRGVIITVPPEFHLPVAEQVAAAGKHVYTEKPIAVTLEDGLRIAALERQHGVTVTVGHSARLMAGIQQIHEAIDRGELGRVAFFETNFSNERALELTPKTWRWYEDKAPGGPLSQLAIHNFDVLRYLGGEILDASAVASKLSPAGAEVDDQSMTLLRFADGKVGYVGSCWTSPGIFSLRVFGSAGLMHYELDFPTWNTPDALHRASTLYIQRGKGGYASREVLDVRPSDMFVAELELFVEACRTGRSGQLGAHNANVALAIVYAALRSVERQGQSVRVSEMLDEAQTRVAKVAGHAV